MIIIRAMDPYELLWMVLLIVFVLETCNNRLTCIWFAAGALAALVNGKAGVNPVVQFWYF